MWPQETYDAKQPRDVHRHLFNYTVVPENWEEQVSYEVHFMVAEGRFPVRLFRTFSAELLSVLR